ncbi:MAG: MFS transporter [Chitinophagaceae bacterium]|nr:MAG: MFS transporter [Chitinophagaceae bacterium]
MQVPTQHHPTAELTPKPAWAAVFGLALGVAGLITSEFLPVSLLTPMATDLRISEGMAGQTISITAVVAMVASLLITTVTKRMDRRKVLLAFSVLQILSNVLVAVAPSFLLLTVGRVLLGIAIGGYWAMLAAIAMRLVPQHFVPKALSIVFGAVSVATVVSAPLGSFLGGILGWRMVFLLAGGLGLTSLIWQAATLPSMRAEKPASLGTLLQILKRPKVKSGLLATIFIFMGYASFFTYLRPFLETVTGVGVNTLSTILTGFGLANLAGTTMARHLLERNLKRTLILTPLLMGLVVGALVLFGNLTIAASVLVALWGAAFGAVQVGWPTWLTRTLPDDAESGGGIQIAAIQLANTTGAAVGGLFFDLTGATGVFVASSAITFVAAGAALFAFRNRKDACRQVDLPEKDDTIQLVA